MAVTNRKYFTAFLFKSSRLADVHCTHKYFGELSLAEAKVVGDVIRSYFQRNGGFHPFMLKFEGVDVFGGGDKRVRVLKAFGSVQRYQNLRATLDLIRPDDYPDWVPHITTMRDGPIESPFGCYALMSGDLVVERYEPVLKFKGPRDYHAAVKAGYIDEDEAAEL